MLCCRTLLGKFGGRDGNDPKPARPTHGSCLKIAQTLYLIDTPGLAEAGVSGTLMGTGGAGNRGGGRPDSLCQLMTETLPSRRNILCWQSLLAIGKRAVVVLNKADRYPPSDLNAPALQRLRSRVAGLPWPMTMW